MNYIYISGLLADDSSGIIVMNSIVNNCYEFHTKI